eukprot:5009325-Karenia_brevis.AAC.1
MEWRGLDIHQHWYKASGLWVLMLWQVQNRTGERHYARHSEQLGCHSPNPWARVKGPMGAIHMHSKEMGWRTQ